MSLFGGLRQNSMRVLRRLFADLGQESPPKRPDPSRTSFVFVYLADKPDHLLVAYRLPKHGWSIDFYQADSDLCGFIHLDSKQQAEIRQLLRMPQDTSHAWPTDLLMGVCDDQLARHPHQQKANIGSWKHFSSVRAELESVATLIPMECRL